MKIVIVGTGYVGLISGLCFSSVNHNVTCVDINLKTVEMLNRISPPFYEKGLKELLKNEFNSNRFKVTSNLRNALIDADIVFLAVGTPSSEDGKVDLTYVENVSTEIGKIIRNTNRYISIIIKSTVLPTTTDTFVREIIEKYSGKKLGEFGLGMNPEFLREGSAINDFIYPDRIVIGYEDSKSKDYLLEIYKSWNCEKILVNTRTAELIKYMNNSLLALLISATNEISNISRSIGGIDYKKVIEGVKFDKRWNPVINKKRVNPEILSYLKPGCGFGGSCLPKDVNALIQMANEKEIDLKIMKNVLEVNKLQPKKLVENLSKSFDLSNKKIFVLGLSFKPGTDDVRESSSLTVINELMEISQLIFAHDPMAVSNFQKLMDNNSSLKYCKDWKKMASKVDIIILMTDWEEYKEIYNINLQNQIVYDARGILEGDKLNCKEYIIF